MTTAPDAHPLAPPQIAARLRQWAEDGVQGPLTLELYPTLLCNLSCRFCDTTLRKRRPTDELSAARLLEIVDEAADLGVRRLFVLGGGEPLLRTDATPAVLRRAKERGLEGVLTTNGTHLDAALAEQLLETAWDEVHVSIDAATPEVHDHLRGQVGAFRRTVRNTCRLSTWRRQRHKSLPRLALHTVITRLNFREIPALLRLARALGAERVDFDALIAYRPEQQALALRPEERAELPGLAAAGLELAEELGLATTLAGFLDPTHLDRGELDVTVPPAPGLRGAPCLKAWHYLVVQADGRTSPCCVLAGEGGSVTQTSLDEVWRHDPFLARVRDGMRAGTPQPRCRECSWNILRHEAEIRRHL